VKTVTDICRTVIESGTINKNLKIKDVRPVVDIISDLYYSATEGDVVAKILTQNGKRRFIKKIKP
jgi:hypothetical protein